MKIDHEKMKQLSRLDDRALWDTVVRMGAEHGLHLSADLPEAKDLEKLRQVLCHTEDLRMLDAMRTVNEYRKKYSK